MRNSLTTILLIALTFAFAPLLSGQTTVILTDGQNNATPYDTTDNDTTFTIDSGSAIQSGAVSGEGNVIKTGGGTVEFTTGLNITGSADVQEGTLALSNADLVFYQTSGPTVGDSTTASLSITGGATLFNTGTLTLGDTSAGHGTLSLSNRTFGFFSMSNTGDVIVGNTGSGTLDLSSMGRLDVTGSTRFGVGTDGVGNAMLDNGFFYASERIILGEGENSTASLTIINNGAAGSNGSLELGAGVGSSAQVTILDGGRLTLQDDESGDALRIGSGSGTISIDDGTLKHTGSPSTTFTTSVPIAISGNTTFDTSGREMRVHGLISGTGALEVIGGGELTLSADNSYTGGTTVSSGILRLGNGGASGSIVGDITNNGWSVAFDRSDDYTFNGVISGTGRLYTRDTLSASRKRKPTPVTRI